MFGKNKRVDIFRFVNSRMIGGVIIRADYIFEDFFKLILHALTYHNQLVLQVSLSTGLRLSDVLNLRTASLAERMTVTERKTGHKRHVRIPADLLDDLLSIAGKIYVFEGRTDYRKPRTRQAVYKDIKRACKALRLSATLQVSPHTARKIYAVNKYKRTCKLDAIKEILGHSGEAVALVYAMADELTRRKLLRSGNKHALDQYAELQTV